VRVRYDEGLATHIGPKPCGRVREGTREASAGEQARPAIEPRKSDRPGCRRCYDGGRQHGRARQASARTARRGHRPWHAWTLLAREPGDLRPDQGVLRPGPHREGEEPKPMMHGPEKSDPAIVATKPANKDAPAQQFSFWHFGREGRSGWPRKLAGLKARSAALHRSHQAQQAKMRIAGATKFEYASRQ